MKKVARYLFVALIISILLVSCIMGDRNTVANRITADDITATFGAQEFHAQLTAIAQEGAAVTPTPLMVIFR